MSIIKRFAWILALVAGIAFIATGPVLVAVGLNGKSTVVSELKQEKVVTPEDASIPNVPVVDAKTAQVQADIIWKHMMESSKGKTYAELDRNDPARTTVMNGDMLRSALMSSILAWNIANLVIGLGVAFFGLGLILAIIGLAIKPAKETEHASVATGKTVAAAV